MVQGSLVSYSVLCAVVLWCAACALRYAGSGGVSRGSYARHAGCGPVPGMRCELGLVYTTLG